MQTSRVNGLTSGVFAFLKPASYSAILRSSAAVFLHRDF
nr:hypothetical protein [Escherichia coli]